MDKNLTTKKDFELFKAECKKWIQIFGLIGWEIHFEHGGTDDDSLAECATNQEGRWAILSLAKEWGAGDKRNEKWIKRRAFHEVDELRFARVADIIRDLRSGLMIPDKMVIDAFHELIRMDENIFFDGFQE